MNRPVCLSATMLLVLFTALSSQDQSMERVERNFRVLGMIADCHEGFAAAVEGRTLLYGSYRADLERALITRATTGSMAIAWRTQPVPASLPDDAVSFVVTAGMYGRVPSGFRFQMSVNDIPRFDFVTTPREDWIVAGREGGQLQFIGVTKDRHGDLFGCLRITLPGAWLRPGEPVQFKIIGEKANHSAWFMVFETPDVVAYQQALTEHEGCFDMRVRAAGPVHVVTILYPPNWQQKELILAFGQGPARTQRLDARGESLSAEFIVNNGEISGPLTVRLNGDLLVRLDTLFAAVSRTLVYPLKLVSLSAQPPDSTGWYVAYRATYHPGLSSSLVGLSEASAGNGTQHLIMSTHQDIAWMDSPENCIRDRDEKIITPLLNIMKNDSSYHFDLEDVLCLREYLDRHPERKAEIHGYMKAGRLGIGASFNQPYEDLCSGEMLVRQFYAGRRWIRTHFPGCDSRTYWNPDVPGRTLQMPQVLGKAGVKYLVMSRFEKGLYSWFSPDGSGILAYSPGHYGDFKARMEGADFERAAAYAASTAAGWLKATRSASPDLPLLSMSDMSGPDVYDTFLAKWNTLKQTAGADGSVSPLCLPPIQYSRIETYLDAVTPALAGLTAIRGERPNIWLYIHGPTHHQAISAKREADFLLPAAEIFNTVEALLSKSFASYPQTELTEAWEAQLYPDHGWGGKNGHITDSTFKAKYESARNVSQHLLSRSLSSIASRVRPRSGSGIPVVVFNSLSWRRSGPVQTTARLDAGVAKNGLALYDAHGTAIPMQMDTVQRHADGSIASARLRFVARGVPSVGYATYYLRPSRRFPTPPVRPSESPSLENDYYRVIMGAGGVRQIVDKQLNETLLDTTGFMGGELFTMQSVGEDAGEWDEPQQPTMEGFDKLSNHPAPWQSVESGPVRNVVEARYALEHATVVQRIILYHTIKRIDFEVSLLGWDGTRYREFRLAFPVRAEGGQVAYEVPFGVLEVGKSEMSGTAGERYNQIVSRVHPRSIQNWIGLSGLHIGVTLGSSVAVWDYLDPTEPGSERLLLQPVLLASRRSCHGAGPWYLQQGDHHYRFSLTSHAPGWQNGHRQGIEANAPLVAVMGASKNSCANLPESRSFVSLDSDNLILSTMKKGEDDETVVVRLYDNTGNSSNSRLKLFTPILEARETDLLEDGTKTIPSEKNRVTLKVGQKAIYTLKITPEW